MKIKKQAKKQLANNPRWQALLLLMAIDGAGAYANVLLDRFVKEGILTDQRDVKLVFQLVYGVTQQRYYLDFQLAPLITNPKIDPWIMQLLRLSVYQFLYLDRIPDRAVVNEAVNIAKLNAHQAVGNFVNGVLRSWMRQGERDVNSIHNRTQRLSIQYSVQPWIVTYLLEHLLEEDALSVLKSLNDMPIVTLRTNTTRISRDDLMTALTEDGYHVEVGRIAPTAIRVISGGNPVHSPLFTTGYFTIQDESSQLVAALSNVTQLSDTHPIRVLDACSAPGGKATHILQLMSQGKLDALDLSKTKLQKVQDHVERMHLTDSPHIEVAYFATDAAKFMPQDNTMYDIIFLDAPCSGLGLMRRKSEIKYTKSFDDLSALADIQATLLDHVSSLLKPGGQLIYSTCTIAYEENESQVAQFLNRHSEFSVVPIDKSELSEPSLITSDGYVRVWPNDFDTDGFFIARMVKTQSNA